MEDAHVMEKDLFGVRERAFLACIRRTRRWRCLEIFGNEYDKTITENETNAIERSVRKN